MNPFFDTHCHLADSQLGLQVAQILDRARSAGVVGLVAVGTDLADSLRSIELAQAEPLVHAAVGVHPNECHLATDQDWARIEELANEPTVVAIGETGLDRHWDRAPFERQLDWFARHIDLSFRLNKPLVIHMRECEADVIEVLQAHARGGKILGIMHSFTGTAEGMQACLELGMFISFAGMVTFKNAGDLREVARQVPLDRLLIETDSPYLTPHPHRGRRPNEPAMVRHTAACLAELFKMPLSEFAQQTTRNARTVLGLGEDTRVDSGAFSDTNEG